MADNSDEDVEEARLTKGGLLARVQKESEQYLDGLRGRLYEFSSQAGEALTGRRDELQFVRDFVSYEKEMGFQDLEARAEQMTQIAMQMRHEKGFRSNLMTSNEHAAIGSSGYGGIYAKRPDVPVGVLVKLWNLEMLDSEALTIEEARRARELEGRPTLDENGEVTGRINSEVKDSYHFLTPERKAEIIRMEGKLLGSIKLLSQTAYNRKQLQLDQFKIYTEGFIQGEGLTDDFLKRVIEVKRVMGIEFTGVVDAARILSYAGGFRDLFLTPQEIMVMGRRVDESYLRKPWTPLALQDQSNTLQKVRDYRKRENAIELRVLTSAFTGFEMPFPIPFEDLTEEGLTVCGPNGRNAEMAKHFKEIANVPYSRIHDWYFKGN